MLRAPVEVELCWPVLSPETPSSEHRGPLLPPLAELQLLNKFDIRKLALKSLLLNPRYKITMYIKKIIMSITSK